MVENKDNSEDLLVEAVSVWKKAQRVYSSLVWKGRPREGHLVQVLAERKDIESKLFDLLDCKDELVVAYVLVTLKKMDSESLNHLPLSLLERREIVREIDGSFAVEYELGEFAKTIQGQWREKHK
jgi:hypothetical protein